MPPTLKDLLVVATTALLTALVASPLLAPDVADAVEPEAAPTAPADRPALVRDGLTLTVGLDKTAYAPGETPVVTLTAVNTTGTPLTLAPRVTMQSQDPVPPMVRMIAMPREVWTQALDLVVPAGETVTRRLEPGVALQAGSTALFLIHAGEQVVVGAQVAVPAPPPALDPATGGPDASLVLGDG